MEWKKRLLKAGYPIRVIISDTELLLQQNHKGIITIKDIISSFLLVCLFEVIVLFLNNIVILVFSNGIIIIALILWIIYYPLTSEILITQSTINFYFFYFKKNISTDSYEKSEGIIIDHISANLKVHWLVLKLRDQVIPLLSYDHKFDNVAEAYLLCLQNYSVLIDQQLLLNFEI